MRQALTIVLSRYPASARPLAEPEGLGHAGGLSGALLWRYQAGRGRLLARAWPTDGPPRAALERIHAWLAAARDLGFIPVPLPALDGRTLHEAAGRSWEVVPWLDGAPLSSGRASPARVAAAYSGLAAFHGRLARPGPSGPSPGIVSRLDELERLHSRGFSTLAGALRDAGAGDLADLARRWREAAVDLAPRVVERLRRAAALTVRIQPCLRDARPENLLFQGDRLTGLVDFGAMAADSVAADLARLNAEWLGPDPALRESALAAYAAIRPLDPAEIALVSVFEDAAAVLLGWHWARWHFLEQRVFNDPGAVAAGLAKGLDRALALACPGAVTLPTPGP